MKKKKKKKNNNNNKKIGVRICIKNQIPEVGKDANQFNSFPPVFMFAASCSHRDPTAKIQNQGSRL